MIKKWEISTGVNGASIYDDSGTIANIPIDLRNWQDNARLIAASPPMLKIIACLAERDCEYPGSAGCDMLPQGVIRSVCLPCKAKLIISEINA